MNDGAGWVLACGREVPDSFTLRDLARHASTCAPCAETVRRMREIEGEARDYARRN